MITRRQAKRMVQYKLSFGMMITKIEDDRSYYIFYCKNKCKKVIPNKFIYIVNRENRNMGFSIISVNDAIQNQTKIG